MDTNKINILPYLKSNNFYNKHTFEEYENLFSLFDENKNFSNHGNLEQWKNILTKLPDISTNYLDFSKECIQIGNPKEINLSQLKILEKGLLNLRPWRKGPFNIFGLEIDSEWRSEKKWQRIEDYLPKFKGMRIGDIGCSNGYYSYKLLKLEPELIVGMDKTSLFIIQFLATKFYAKQIQELIILPCSAEEFNPEFIDFDLLLSMGILYHAKNPSNHLASLQRLVKKNGYIILETIISNLKQNINIGKNQTYAGMSNIGTIFTKENLIKLLNVSGFKNIQVINDSFTNISEQRTTKWMQGKSLSDFILSNGDTLEGYPPVCRTIFIAQKK